jgi:hypothetical protein
MKIPQMHRYVAGWLSLAGLCAITFPIAMWRVSQTPKFPDQAFRSQNCAAQDTPTRTVITSEMCGNLKVAPLPAKK